MQLPSALLILQPLGSMLYMRSGRKYAYLMRSNLLCHICLCGLFFCVLLPARAGAAVTVAAFVPMSIAFQLCASPQGPAGNGVLAFSWSTECWSARSGR